MSTTNSSSSRPEQLALIGCGPAARENYLKSLPTLLPPTRRLKLVVDVRSKQQEIEAFFDKLAWRPDALVFLDGTDDLAIQRGAFPQMEQLYREHCLDGLLILTEPKSHLPYLTWGMERNLSVLVEKPLSAPVDSSNCPERAHEIWSDFERIRTLARKHPGSNVSVMAQRRCHRVYDFIRNTIAEVVTTFGIPVTKVDISYSDGMWNMPEEFNKENHPYKYGYGMLHHGGYHFIDLLSQLVELNSLVPSKRPSTVSCFSQAVYPSDNDAQITERDLALLLSERGTRIERPYRYGELDLHSMMCWRRDGKLICNANVNLQHTGITRRAWRKARPDSYKGNGRIKQERIHVQVGPLLDIFLNSSEIIQPGDHRFDTWIEEGALGGSNHYEVTILRNAAIIGGLELERKTFTDFYPEGLSVSAMRLARNELIKRFLEGENPSPIQGHALTNYHMAIIAESLTPSYQGQRPVSKGMIQ